jgi:hypothetical protein
MSPLVHYCMTCRRYSKYEYEEAVCKFCKGKRLTFEYEVAVLQELSAIGGRIRRGVESIEDRLKRIEAGQPTG